MTYSGKIEIRVGDVVAIGASGKGTIVACIDRDEYSPDHNREHWAYLGKGVIIDTDFGGLIHYPDQASVDADRISLITRGRDL